MLPYYSRISQQHITQKFKGLKDKLINLENKNLYSSRETMTKECGQERKFNAQTPPKASSVLQLKTSTFDGDNG